VFEDEKGSTLLSCPLESFERSSPAISYRLFWETRWEFLLMGAEISNLYVYSKDYTLSPVDLNFSLLYIKDI
jgi:hypothetical protein